MDSWKTFFAYDWQIFMAAVAQWSHGGNPYGFLEQLSLPAGIFPYPPTALTWMYLFLPLGSAGYYIWSALQVTGWFLLIRRRIRSQLVLLFWSPMVFHLLLGQSTLAVVLIMWAATVARRRGLWWGIVVALALTKPQTALLPTLWLVWQDRQLPHRHFFWIGILAGTMALAIPPTIMNQGIWIDWLGSLSNRESLLLLKAPWQGFGSLVLITSTVLWFLKNRGNQSDAGWQWWISAALFPQSSIYPSVTLLPLLRPKKDYWTLAGLALSGVLIGPATETMLPIVLAGHFLAAWFISGGPRVGRLEES